MSGSKRLLRLRQDRQRLRQRARAMRHIPKLYKYLDPKGAELTLANRTFRHARPSDFNDGIDMTVQKVFEGDERAALEAVKSQFNEIIFKNLERTPTCASLKMQKQINQLQALYRAEPQLRTMLQAELARDALEDIYNLQSIQALNEQTIEDVNRLLQGFRVLCVTSHADSKLMWDRYAAGGTGISICVRPNLAQDSKFQLFRQVRYLERRPPLYPNVGQFIEDSLFGDQEAKRLVTLENIIYAKTTEWEDEAEWRLAIALRDGETHWDVLPYHPSEISEIRFGPNTSDKDRRRFSELATTVNPAIVIH